MSRILHADLDAFYASVEQRDNPALKGRPIAVGGGVILAPSYEARRFGVRTAMTQRQALALCPQLITVDARMQAYTEASAAVFAIFHDTSPEVEGLSIDEAFIDVTGLGRVSGTDAEIGRRLRRRTASEVGLALSVGGASTKFLAKVASATAKPDGLTIVPDGAELDFLHPLPVGRLWGVGRVTEERLLALGLSTVHDIATLDAEILAGHIGLGAARHLHALANNIDPRPVDTGRRRRSIGSQRSFRAGSMDRQGVDHLLLDIVDRVTRRLRAGERVGRTVVLRLRYGDFSQATRSLTLPNATSSTGEILSAAQTLLTKAWPAIEQRGLTKVGIAITGLTPDNAVQLTLPFTKGQPALLDQAVDRIRERYGIGSLTRAPLIGKPTVEMPLLPD